MGGGKREKGQACADTCTPVPWGSTRVGCYTRRPPHEHMNATRVSTVFRHAPIYLMLPCCSAYTCSTGRSLRLAAHPCWPASTPHHARWKGRLPRLVANPNRTSIHNHDPTTPSKHHPHLVVGALPQAGHLLVRHGLRQVALVGLEHDGDLGPVGTMFARKNRSREDVQCTGVCAQQHTTGCTCWTRA